MATQQTIKERLAIHYGILAEIARKREETGIATLFSRVEARILREHCDALEQRVPVTVRPALPRPILIARGRNRWLPEAE